MKNVLFKIRSLYESLTGRIDPALFLFLLFMLNYRISFKILAIAGIYLYRPHFRFRRDGIVLFYLSMIVLSIFNIAVLSDDHTFGHWSTVLSSCAVWLLCLLAYHQLNLSLRTSDNAKIRSTLGLVVIVNFAATMWDYLMAVKATGALNPYTQISPPPYGISTGDLMGGVYGGMHLVNTIISCFFVVFFIYERRFLYVILSLLPFLLTGSNLGTIILALLMIFILLFRRNMLSKYYALFCLSIAAIFYIKITPQNGRYMQKVLKQVTAVFSKKETIVQDSVRTMNAPAAKAAREFTREELADLFSRYKRRHLESSKVRRGEIKVLRSINALEKKKTFLNQRRTDEVFYKKDSLQQAKNSSEFFEYGKLKKFDFSKEPGKLISFRQTSNYLSSSWKTALFGGGPGSFSSRAAFVNSKIIYDSRLLALLPFYQTEEFRDNHQAIFKYLMYLDDETHSITNLPFCWYNQVFGEYGILGFLLFLILYLGYFVKRLKLFSMGTALFLSMLLFFLFDYWYERLSVMIIFELLLLYDIRRKSEELNNAE